MARFLVCFTPHFLSKFKALPAYRFRFVVKNKSRTVFRASVLILIDNRWRHKMFKTVQWNNLLRSSIKLARHFGDPLLNFSLLERRRVAGTRFREKGSPKCLLGTLASLIVSVYICSSMFPRGASGVSCCCFHWPIRAYFEILLEMKSRLVSNLAEPQWFRESKSMPLGALFLPHQRKFRE